MSKSQDGLKRAELQTDGSVVLVAEDNPVNQELIVHQLSLLGYPAEVAGDGEEALKLLRAKKFGLLLTDCQMPRMDGFTLAGEVRRKENGSSHRLPIVAVTANVVPEDVQLCYEAGMDDYLSKPVELDALQQMLDKWLPAQPADDSKDVPAGEAGNSSTGGSPVSGAVLDLSTLTNMVGEDPALINRFLTKFKTTTLETAQAIHNAHVAHSAAGLRQAAHKLKSSARAVGAIALADLCQGLEKASKANDWRKVESLLPEFRKATESVVDEIDRRLEGRS